MNNIRLVLDLLDYSDLLEHNSFIIFLIKLLIQLNINLYLNQWKNLVLVNIFVRQ